MLLTGVSPHRFEGDLSTMSRAIIEGKIIPPARLDQGLKGDLEVIVMKALRRMAEDGLVEIVPNCGTFRARN